jgi:hypothetical protein
VYEAKQIAESHGSLFRVVSPLGPNDFLTMDYLPFRVDVDLASRTVGAVHVG